MQRPTGHWTSRRSATPSPLVPVKRDIGARQHYRLPRFHCAPMVMLILCREDREAVVDAVAVRVFEQADAHLGLVLHFAVLDVASRRLADVQRPRSSKVINIGKVTTRVATNLLRNRRARQSSYQPGRTCCKLLEQIAEEAAAAYSKEGSSSICPCSRAAWPTPGDSAAAIELAWWVPWELFALASRSLVMFPCTSGQTHDIFPAFTGIISTRRK